MYTYIYTSTHIDIYKYIYIYMCIYIYIYICIWSEPMVPIDEISSSSDTCLPVCDLAVSSFKSIAATTVGDGSTNASLE